MATLNNPASPDNESFKDQRDILREINAELGKKISNIKSASKEYSGLESIAKKLQNDEEDITKLSEKQLKDLKAKAVINLRDLKAAAEKLNTTNAITDAEKALLAAKKDQFQVEEALLNNIQKRLNQEININKSLGISGNLLKGMSGLLNKLGLGALNNVINFEEINKKLRKQAELLTNNGEKSLGFFGKLRLASNAIGLLGGQIFKALLDPLAIIGLIVKGFQKLIELGFAADKEIVDLSKSMSSSREQAANLRQHFVDIQNGAVKVGGSLNDNLKITKNLVAAQLELANAFGTGLGFTDRQVADQVLLTKQIGLSADEAAGLQQLAMANGKTADDIVDATIAQTAALAKQTGIQLNNKKVLSDVAKVSGQLRLQYQNNPELIAKAVIQTQKLGISLDQAKKMAEGLLDFESSIANELEAELLTGKDLNLEQARLLALNGDSAGATAEMLKNIKSSAEFSKMNVIQQQSLAKAVGMSTDDLANSLIQQENLNRLGDTAKKDIEDRVKLLKQQGREQEAQQLMASIGNEKDAKDALTKIDAQTNFNNLIEKLQGILGSMAEGPMAEILDTISKWASSTENMKGLMEGIKTVASAIGSIISFIAEHWYALAQIALAFAAFSAYSSAAAVPVIGPVLGFAAAAAVEVYGNSLLNSINDGMIDPKGGLVVSGEKGTYKLNENDSIIAGTDLNKKSTGGGGGVSVDMSSVVIELQNVKSILNQILTKEGTVNMDTTKVGTTTNMGTYKVQ